MTETLCRSLLLSTCPLVHFMRPSLTIVYKHVFPVMFITQKN